MHHALNALDASGTVERVVLLVPFTRTLLSPLYGTGFHWCRYNMGRTPTLIRRGKL